MAGRSTTHTVPAARTPAAQATPPPAAARAPAQHRGLGNDFLSRAVSAPGDQPELHAHERARQVLSSPPGAYPIGGPAEPPHLPAGVPAAVAEQAGAGRPLGSTDRAFFEPRFGAGLGHVRVHDGLRAAALADAAGAAAFTVGSHIFLGRDASTASYPLLAHELAHVEQRHTRPVLWRAPKTKGGGGGRPVERLEVFADSMSYAAQVLAEGFRIRFGPGRRVFVGLTARYVSFFDTDGAPIDRVSIKEDHRFAFHQGVYVNQGGRLVAITIFQGDVDGPWMPESAGGSVVGHRIPAEGQKPAEPEKPAKSAEPELFRFEDVVSEPDRVRAALAAVTTADIVYFVPSIEAKETAVGKQTGSGTAQYTSQIETRGDGLPANEPPWPVSIEGPKLVPIEANPTYSSKVDWTANGNFSVAAQVISQVGETIHYRWERFDITKYARQQLAANPVGTAPPPPGAEKTLDQRIAEFTGAKAGAGTDVTGMGGAKHEFAREFDDWWKDTKRAARGAANPGGDTTGQRLSNAAANRLALELAPVSLLVTTLGATLRLIADLFAGPRVQQEIPFEREGIFLIRVITTPGINEDRQGRPIVRPPSVAARVTEVAPMDRNVRESLDEPAAQLAELQAQIDLAKAAGDAKKAEYLASLLAEAKLRFEGTPLQLLRQRRTAKLTDPTVTGYAREQELAQLDDQIALAVRHEQQRTAGAGADLAPAVRLNATLISEVTGEQYPLLISSGPMARDGTKHRWLISDVTNRDGEAYIGLGDTPSGALLSALTKFGGKAAYGRGRIGVRTAGLGLEAGAPAELLVDSQPTDWALAEKRLDDLVMTLAALGLFVASAGVAGAVVGAGVAAARLIHRWQAGTLRLDAQTVNDVLGVLGGLGAAGQLAAGLRMQRFEKMFAITVEGGTTTAQIEAAAQALRGAQTLSKVVAAANEAINYGGLLWGNVQFLDQMVSIAAQERSGALTHAAARRARANAISSAVQNSGLFLAANVIKAKGRTAAEKPTPEKPPAGEEGPATRETTTARPEPAPIGERRATLTELRGALPTDLRQKLTVDPTLKGDTVRVDYTVDPSTRLITEIRIRCGPDARPGTVALHTETVRTMEKYQGFSGRVQQALNWLRDLVGVDTLDPGNKPQFEAQLEIRKLPKLIEAQLDRMKAMEPGARDRAEAELAKLQVDLDRHLRTLDLGPIGEGVGYVAAEGLSKAKQRRYAELLERLRQHEAGSDTHKKIRREMYELIGGTLEYPAWESIYQANVTRARKANAVVAAEHSRLGWGETEVTVEVGKEVRRLDIADVKSRRGVEVKAYETGRIYASEEILAEVRRDAALVRQGWSIKWILIDTEASGPLLQALRDARILVELRDTVRGGTEFSRRILPPRR
ncbi:protein of unknown function [Micromonospora rhizosphaerae]|uniref:eCIS core domain-containing protein n=1 Tax=Micromonospora rhizosphaerae TaxID=568872 RepID=A0A1C6SZC9_9ACTN|nr:DUF4157 domain-containing protein [Micromonospora rhizosphaerae]SCL34944.1 protein of unknown function [Micromonospora rhizosphaerae]